MQSVPALDSLQAINWTMKVTNREVRRRLNIKDLMQKIMRRKLSLFGHICRMEDSRKIKAVMLGVMDGRSRATGKT